MNHRGSRYPEDWLRWLEEMENEDHAADLVEEITLEVAEDGSKYHKGSRKRRLN